MCFVFFIFLPIDTNFFFFKKKIEEMAAAAAASSEPKRADPRWTMDMEIQLLEICEKHKLSEISNGLKLARTRANVTTEFNGWLTTHRPEMRWVSMNEWIKHHDALCQGLTKMRRAATTNSKSSTHDDDGDDANGDGADVDEHASDGDYEDDKIISNSELGEDDEEEEEEEEGVEEEEEPTSSKKRPRLCTCQCGPHKFKEHHSTHTVMIFCTGCGVIRTSCGS